MGGAIVKQCRSAECGKQTKCSTKSALSLMHASYMTQIKFLSKSGSIKNSILEMFSVVSGITILKEQIPANIKLKL